MLRRLGIAIGIAGCLFGSNAAMAKEVVVKVDGRSMPWRTGINPKLAFGLSNGRPPTVVFDRALVPAAMLRITATGRTTTFAEEMSFGPEGMSSWIADRGAAVFPSYHMKTRDRPVHLNELVGAFIDADGQVVGMPFPIGASAKVEVPDGAAALSLGINDDNFSDNTGSLTVSIAIAEPRVTVENPTE